MKWLGSRGNRATPPSSTASGERNGGDPGLLIGVTNLIYFISNIVQQEIEESQNKYGSNLDEAKLALKKQMHATACRWVREEKERCPTRWI